MKLEGKEISSLLNTVQLIIEDRYRGKLDGDEYFKRGFLLGCLEMKKKLQDFLNEYELYTKN